MNLLAYSFLQGVLLGVLFIVCLLLIGIVLLQKGRGGGLTGALGGGGGGGGGAFGAKTGDVFTVITVGLALLFLLLVVVGNWVFSPPKESGGSKADVAPVGAPAAPDGMTLPASDDESGSALPGEADEPVQTDDQASPAPESEEPPEQAPAAPDEQDTPPADPMTEDSAP